MRTDSSAQSFVKRAFSSKKDRAGDPAREKPSLMFAAGPQETDVLTEFLELQKGVGYFAQPSKTTMRYFQDREHVFVRIDLLGIHICDNPAKDSQLLEFPIEEIIKYSHNRGKETFSFSHMDEQGLMREFKFRSEKYFEIFEALGRAIAIIIKIKNKKLSGSKTPPLDRAEGSLSSLLETDEAAMEDAGQGRSETFPGHKRLSYKHDTLSSHRRSHRISTQRSLDQLMNPDSDTETGTHSDDGGLAQKATLAKLYIESRYHAPESKSSPSSHASSSTQPPASQGPEQRRWKNQMRYDYASVSKSRSRSDPTLLTDDSQPPTASASRRSSIGSQHTHDLITPTVDPLANAARESIGSIRSLRSLHSKTTSEPLMSSPGKKVNRSSVMGLFGSGVRPRAESEQPRRVDERYGESAHTGEIGDMTEDVPEKDKYGSLSGLKKMAAKVTVKRKKQVSPELKAGVSTESIAETHIPAVAKTYDSSGKEVLIKNLRGNGYEITAGTVDALVEALIDQSEDPQYLDTFLLTFRHFVTPATLLTKLSNIYKKQVDRIKEVGRSEARVTVMNRICSVVKKWAGEHSYDFLAPACMDLLTEFLGIVQSTEQSSYSKQIRSLVQHELDNYLSILHADAEPDLKPEDLVTLLRDFDITSQSSRKIAQQLTVVDSKLFREIRPEEFTILLWGTCTDFSSTSLARNLQRYIARFNQLGYWVATTICSTPSPSKRVDVLEHFIKIAAKSMEIGNYNTAMAILSGLNTTPVSRMKKTFSGLSSRAQSAYADVEQKLSYRQNYKAYRELEHQTKGPVLPFFGLVIKDLTFLNDGNQKILPNGLTNFEKMRGIWNVIGGIREWQRGKFPWERDEDVIVPSNGVTLHRYCANPPCLTEEQLITLSKVVEPPEKERERQRSISGSFGRMGGKALQISAVMELVVDVIYGRLVGAEQTGKASGLSKEAAGAQVPAVSILSATPDDQHLPLDEEPELDLNQLPPSLSRLPSDVLGFLGSPSPSRSPSSTNIKGSARNSEKRDSVNRPNAVESKSVVERRTSMDKGGTLRRRLSEGGLGSIIGWWKKEEVESKGEDAEGGS